jgi:hypothetical protein
MGQNDCGGFIPANPALAVGDTFVGVLQIIDECVIVFDKNGNLQPGYPKSLVSFFGHNGCGIGPFGARALYDWINHRYVVLAADICSAAFPTAGSYWLAVSTGDSPTGSYCIRQIPVQTASPAVPDFVRLGQDRQGVYLASNVYTIGSTFLFEEILALPKSALYSCTSLNIVSFGGLTDAGIHTDSTQPVNIYNPGDDPRVMYFVTSENLNFGGGQCVNGCGGLIVWGLYDPFGAAPQLSSAIVATANNYQLPPFGSQPGALSSIDTGDTRISGAAVYSSGSIFASLTTNGTSFGPACILYQIKPFVDRTTGLMASATMLNEIFVEFRFGPPDSHPSQYYCTQQPDPEGNVTTVLNVSDSATVYPTLWYTTRRSAEPSGQFEFGLALQKGGAAYTFGGWGRYTATAPAGLVSGGATGGFPTFWFTGMYAKSDGTWGTAIGKNGYSNITQE